MTEVATQKTQLERIENKIDRTVAGNTPISKSAGGLVFSSMTEVLEFSKLMAVSDLAVPKYLRGNPGACLAIVIQAVEWRMSPYAVANKSYVVNDRVSYESQLIHAVIEQRAAISGRLRHRFEGQGDSRRCIVWAFVEGEADAFEFTSSPFSQIQPKNSPLWKTKPDLQLYYNASRDWARMYFPDVILGVYAEDELDAVPSPAKPRLPAGKTLDELTDRFAPLKEIQQDPLDNSVAFGTVTSHPPEPVVETPAPKSDPPAKEDQPKEESAPEPKPAPQATPPTGGLSDRMRHWDAEISNTADVGDVASIMVEIGDDPALTDEEKKTGSDWCKHKIKKLEQRSGGQRRGQQELIDRQAEWIGN